MQYPVPTQRDEIPSETTAYQILPSCLGIHVEEVVRAVKGWGWIIAGLVWLLGDVAYIFDFRERALRSVIGIVVPISFPRQFGLVLFYLLLFGWTIPFAIGVCRLVKASQNTQAN